MKKFIALLLLLAVTGCVRNPDSTVRYSAAKPATTAAADPLPVNPLPPAPTPAPAPVVVTPPVMPKVIVIPQVKSPTLVLPTTITGEIGEPLEVIADTNCDNVQWYPIDPGLRQFQTHKLLNDEVKSAIVWAHVPGSYRLLGYAGNSTGITRPVITTIVITGSVVDPTPTVVPDPPKPGPVDPTPKPPVPVTDQRVPLKSLFVVTIDDWSQRKVGNWLASASSLNNIRSQVKEMAVADKTSAEATLYAKFITMAGGLPVMLIMDSTTKPWTVLNKSELKLPDSETASAELLGRYGK